MPVPGLHNSDDDFKMLMDADEYNGIWRKIASLQRKAHGESFWQEVEAILNTCCTELFMVVDATAQEIPDDEEAGSSFQYVIGLDDDKLHYNYSKSTKTDGLKKGHHAKDNRHGFTAHTACNSATAFPLNVSFQRKNETVRVTTDRMLDDMFGKHTGGANRLDNVELAMDRGYWDAVLLFRLLDQGANIHGTIKRQDWLPLTYDKSFKEMFPVKPKEIPRKGFKDSYYMDLKWKGKLTAQRKVTMVGYRPGTMSGAISLCVSSCYRRTHWDLIPYNAKDDRWYHDSSLSRRQKQMKALQLFEGEDNNEECIDLMLDEMEPRTCSQGTADWFLDRQLSGTSSTISELVIAVAPTIGLHNDMHTDFDTVLSYAGFLMCSAVKSATTILAATANQIPTKLDSKQEPALQSTKSDRQNNGSQH